MSGQERLLDLLVSRATEGLSENESRELDLALHEFDGMATDDLDLAAAAAYLVFDASAPEVETMPDRVKAQILERAPSRGADDGAQTTRRGVLDPRYLGWYAAAAMLLLALWAPWSPRTERAAPAPTFAEQRALLMESAPDLIRVAWSTPEIEAYAQVTGDVVWSTRRQAGFMRLSGLPANRSTVEQYQLWIVDPSRDEQPIDGGVFDIPAGADEVVVPIDAKLRTDDPKVFAITLEKPGGVVVSDGPLLVVAPVQA